ncbi:MAG: hypothetical protein PHN95_02435 [Candidatus Pacebacteria bacterium]|jgi:hypothetical protein|nr:hypothetical protein [Candidatus Paceibacterota bacterium]
MRDPKTIISEIKDLLDELGSSLGVKTGHGQIAKKTKIDTSPPRGVLGAINMLIEEKFFDTPKEISAVIEKLKEVGHYHKSTAVAMNLLNLTKRRTLNRFKNKETKNWEYVIRK